MIVTTVVNQIDQNLIVRPLLYYPGDAQDNVRICNEAFVVWGLIRSVFRTTLHAYPSVVSSTFVMVELAR